MLELKPNNWNNEEWLAAVKKIKTLADRDIRSVPKTIEFLINEELIEGYKPALEDNGRRFMVKDGNFIKFKESNTIKPNSINSDDFLTVIDRRKPSVSPELLEEYEKWTSKYQAI